MDLAAFREAGHDAIDRICLYFQHLQSNSIPVTVPSEPGSLRKHIPDGPPLHGEFFTDITKDFEQIILPGCTHWQHPAFFGFFPANSTFESIIADMYSSAINNPGFNWSCSPTATDLEFIMMDWVADLLGLDELYKSSSKKGGGIIMGSASEAFFIMCVAARERATTYASIETSVDTSVDKGSTTLAGVELDKAKGKSQLQHDAKPADRADHSNFTRKLVMYGSSEAHSMGSKAAKMLGLRWKSIAVGAENGWKLTGKALRETLEEDVSISLIPCMLLVTLGGTNFGNVDCLDELVEVARDYPALWVHVDAAWAGSYLSLEECRQELHLKTINQRPLDNEPLEAANAEQREYCFQQPPGIVHSFCTNLHKSGLVGFDCTTSFVRNKYLIISAIEKSQACLESWEGKADPALDIRNWEVPLGRRFRSLKVYFVLRSYGIEGFRKELARTIELTKYFETLIHDSTVLESVAPRSLALVVFRMNSMKGVSGIDEKALEETCNFESEQLATSLEATHQIFLTSCNVDGKFCLRLAVGRLSRQCDIDSAWNLIIRCAQDIATDCQYLNSQGSKTD